MYFYLSTHMLSCISHYQSRHSQHYKYHKMEHFHNYNAHTANTATSNRCPIMVDCCFASVSPC